MFCRGGLFHPEDPKIPIRFKWAPEASLRNSSGDCHTQQAWQGLAVTEDNGLSGNHHRRTREEYSDWNPSPQAETRHTTSLKLA